MTNNTADRVDAILATFLFDWHQIDDHNADKSDYHKAKTAILKLLEAEKRKAETQMQLDDRLVMLGWIEPNKDNLKVSEIIGTLQAQVKDLEAELSHLTTEEGKEDDR